MNIRKMTKEELELLSHTKIAEELLKEANKSMTTAELFSEVCKLLEMSEKQYQDKITDFFQSLITAKEFILLEDGNWDLKANHSVKIDIDEIYEEEEEIEADEELDDSVEDEMVEDNYDDSLEDDDYVDEELGDLSIVSEEELEE